jgi:succinoglycan biosynthesis transport protein ExoP
VELSDYLAVVRKHWVVIALIGLLGLGAAYGYSKSLPATYRATSSVYVSVPRGSSVGDLVQGANYADDRIESYAQLAVTPFVLEPVIDRLDLSTTARSLRGAVTATRPVNTSILEISVTSNDREGSAEIANAVSAELARAVAEVEGDVTWDQPTIQLTMVAHASPPLHPAGPNTRLISATGLLGGLVLGVVLALARTLVDTRVRSARDLRLVSDAAVLTSVRNVRKMAREPLAMRSDPLGEEAEAFRRLRTNLRFLNLVGPSRSIIVTSALPSEGKSTVAINLAVAMAEGSSRILLIDADLRKSSVSRYLGLEGAVGLTTVLIGEAAVEDVIQRWGGSFDVLPAGQIPPNPSELLDSAAMSDLLWRLGAWYNTILLDTSPLLPVTDAAALSRFTDGALVVVGCQKVHRHQVAEALGSLAAVNARVLGIVLNQVHRRESGGTYTYGSTPRATTKVWAHTLLHRNAGAKSSQGFGAPLEHDSTPPPTGRGRVRSLLRRHRATRSNRGAHVPQPASVVEVNAPRAEGHRAPPAKVYPARAEDRTPSAIGNTARAEEHTPRSGDLRPTRVDGRPGHLDGRSPAVQGYPQRTTDDAPRAADDAAPGPGSSAPSVPLRARPGRWDPNGPAPE